MISQPERWQRISRHPIGGSQQALLIDKLTTEQGWSRQFAGQAVAEYLRFAYLACISPTPVTPSRAVDAVWHLHLTFSRDYWLRFCPDALGRELHHEPDDGVDADAMASQYRATLALYRREFDAPPPAAVWGGDRPRPVASRAGPGLLALSTLLGAGAAIAANDGESGDYGGIIALAGLALLIVAIWRIFVSPRRIKTRRGKDGGGSGCGSCSTCSSGASCGSGCGGGGD